MTQSRLRPVIQNGGLTVYTLACLARGDWLLSVSHSTNKEERAVIPVYDSDHVTGQDTSEPSSYFMFVSCNVTQYQKAIITESRLKPAILNRGLSVYTAAAAPKESRISCRARPIQPTKKGSNS